jgi:hypothetical protein
MKFFSWTGLVLAMISGANARTRIRMAGRMEITNEEIFGGDEHATRRKDFPTIYLEYPQSRKTEVSWIERMGGEIRIEVFFTFTMNADESIIVTHNMKLFEGTSATNDPYAEESRNWYIGAASDAGFEELHSEGATVRNTDEGGDWASINISMYITKCNSMNLQCADR